MDIGVALPVLAAIAAIYLAAGLVKGATGFGLPVVSVALLPFVVPVEMALALNAIVIFVTNVQQIRQAGAIREGLRAAWPMMVGMAVMVPLGALFAERIAEQTLMAILGSFILLFVASNFLNPALKIPDGQARNVGFGMGLVSGVVGGLTSAPGPIFVMYVVALHLARPVFMTALGFIMATFGLSVAASYIWVGLLRWEHAGPGMLSIPPVLLGMWLGNKWAARLPMDHFRKIVLLLLGVLACLLIRRAVF
ncbi:MAG: sulfite exporter TauE/SafE family protein [Paracoccaceae bacterium]